jgi:hypothetical protein
MARLEELTRGALVNGVRTGGPVKILAHRRSACHFQLVMAILEASRFERKFRHGVHGVDRGDKIRRRVKPEMGAPN